METDDFIYYKQGDKIMSGGMCIDSILLKNNIQPLHQLQSGGSKNRTVPVGLMCLLNGGRGKNRTPQFNYQAVQPDLYEKLLTTYIASGRQIKYESSKTRRKKSYSKLKKTVKNKKNDL